jgi:hypothetical protein
MGGGARWPTRSSTAVTTGFVRGHRGPATTNNRLVHVLAACCVLRGECGAARGRAERETRLRCIEYAALREANSISPYAVCRLFATCTYPPVPPDVDVVGVPPDVVGTYKQGRAYVRRTCSPSASASASCGLPSQPRTSALGYQGPMRTRLPVSPSGQLQQVHRLRRQPGACSPRR